MNTSTAIRWLAAFGAGVFATLRSPGETSLNLDVGFGIRFVPPSIVTVPAGELLRVTAPNLGPLQWKRNGVAITGATESTLVLPAVSTADAGTYLALYTAPEMAGRTSQSLVLGVGRPNRFTNLSARAQIGGGEKAFIAGFVVNTSDKKVIIRAVGPSLAQFGIREPLARPAIAIFDQNGRPYTNAYVYPAVVGGPTYESDLADSLARAGAFPLPAGSKDVTELRPFAAGAYTVQVTSADGGSGIVLLEIYEVP